MKKSVIVFVATFALAVSSCSSNKLESKSTEEKKAEAYYGQGTAELVNKDYTQALINLLKARELTPGDSKVRNNLAMAYYFKKQPDQALAELNEAVRLDGKNSEARVNLGSILMEKNKLQEARLQFEKVLEDLTFSNLYRNYYNLGILSLKEGDRREAFLNLEKAIKEKDDYCPAHYKLGELYSEEYKFQKALSAFKESGKGTCVSEPAPFYQQALALLNLNRNPEATQKFKEVMEKFPGTRYSSLANSQLKKIEQNENQQTLSKGYQTEVIKEPAAQSQSVETPNF